MTLVDLLRRVQGNWLEFIGSEDEEEPNETSNLGKFIGSNWEGVVIDWGGTKGDDVAVWEWGTKQWLRRRNMNWHYWNKISFWIRNWKKKKIMSWDEDEELWDAYGNIVSWKMACLEKNTEWVWRLKNLKLFMWLCKF